MSILDDVIANTPGAARVVGSNNDLSKITVNGDDMNAAIMGAAGVWLRDGKWDSCEMGLSQAEAQARFDAANTPEKRAALMADLQRRARERAGLDVTAAGEVAMFTDDEKGWWHRLGTLVTGAVNAKQAREWGKIDFPVIKMPYYKPIADLGDAAEGPTTAPSDRAFYIARGDTGATLADYAGPEWEPIQAAQATDFLDEIIGEFGARYATAGSLFGGRKIWVQIYLPKQSFTLPGGDEVQAFGTWVDSRVPGEAWILFPTEDRAVCRNTLRVATEKDSGKGIRGRHVGNVKAKLAEARTAFGYTVKAMDEFKGAAEVLTRTQLDPEPYFEGLLDEVLDITKAQADLGIDALAAALSMTEAQVKATERAVTRRERLLGDFRARYFGEKCAIAPAGSAWKAFNAVTEASDHSPLLNRYKGTDVAKDSRRFENSVAGDGDSLKQAAYQMALAAAN